MLAVNKLSGDVFIVIIPFFNFFCIFETFHNKQLGKSYVLSGEVTYQ